MSNQFVRDTCMLIRHDAASEYHEDGWKRKAAMLAGGAAAIGAAGYAGHRNRDKIAGAYSAGKKKITGSYSAGKRKMRQMTGSTPKLKRGENGNLHYFKDSEIEYHEDGWKRRAAMALGGAAAIGAAGYLGGTKRGRQQTRQAAGYVKRKAGSAYGAAKQATGNVRQKLGSAYGSARKKASDVAFRMSPKGTTRQTSLF